MITSSIHGVLLSAVCSAQLLGLRATGVTHPAMVLVMKAPATQAKINFQIRNPPADGTRAATWKKRGFRYVAVFGQLSDKPLFAVLCTWGAKC